MLFNSVIPFKRYDLQEVMALWSEQSSNVTQLRQARGVYVLKGRFSILNLLNVLNYIWINILKFESVPMYIFVGIYDHLNFGISYTTFYSFFFKTFTVIFLLLNNVHKLQEYISWITSATCQNLSARQLTTCITTSYDSCSSLTAINQHEFFLDLTWNTLMGWCTHKSNNVSNTNA